MFCYKNSKSGENNPKQNYVNLGTGIRVNSMEHMFRYKDRESGENTPKQTGGRTKVGHQFCSWCKEVGHNIFHCPLAVIPQWVISIDYYKLCVHFLIFSFSFLKHAATSGNSKTYCCWATRNTARSVALPNFLF
ncbi:unnamed protein product [Prunus brigantina]